MSLDQAKLMQAQFEENKRLREILKKYETTANETAARLNRLEDAVHELNPGWMP